MGIYTKSKTTTANLAVTENTSINIENSIKLGIDKDVEGLVINYLTSLYADPATAVVRELFTNACDSNAGSGKSVKVIVKESEKIANAFDWAFVDYGKGMSHEELEKNYIQYAKSTKTSDFETVGSFGLGSKSPMALTSGYKVVTSNGEEVHECVVERTNDGIYAEIKKVGEKEPSYTRVSFDGISADVTDQMLKYLVSFLAPLSGTSVTVKRAGRNCELKELYRFDLGDVEGYHCEFYSAYDSIAELNGAFVNKKLQVVARVGNVTYPLDGNKVDYDNTNNYFVVDVTPGYFAFAPSREELPAGQELDHLRELFLDRRRMNDNILGFLSRELGEDFAFRAAINNAVKDDNIRVSGSYALKGDERFEVFVRDFSKLQMSEEKKSLVKKFYFTFSTISDNFYNDWIKVQSPETEKPDFAGFDNVFILSWPNWYGDKSYWCRNTVYSEMKRFARVCVSYHNDEDLNNNYYETKILVHNGLKIMKNGKPQMPIGQFKTDRDNDLNKRTADKERKICGDLEEAGVFEAKNSVTGAVTYHRPRTHFRANEFHVFVKAGETIPNSLTKMLKLLSTKIVFEGNLVHEEQNDDSIVFDELDYTRRSNPATKQSKKARKDAEKYELLLDGVERMMTLSEIEQECANKYVNLAGEYYLPSNEQRIISVLSGKRIMRTKAKTKALLAQLEKIGIQSVVLSEKAFNLEPNILDDIIGVDTSDFKDTNWTQRGLTEWHHIQGSEMGYRTFRFWEKSGQVILVEQRKDFVVSCFVCDYEFFDENRKYFKVEPGLDEYGLKLLRRTLPAEMPERFVKELPSLFDIKACEKDGVTIPEEIASLF